MYKRQQQPVPDRLTGPRTRALVLNSPSNPTGAVIPRETVEELMSWAAGRGLVVVSDDCYDEMWLDAPVECTARVAADAAARGLPMPPVASVFSFSKTHAMTGFRLGYVVCPPELTPRVPPLPVGVPHPGDVLLRPGDGGDGAARRLARRGGRRDPGRGGVLPVDEAVVRATER